MSPAPGQSQRERLLAVLAEPVSAAGYDLEEIEVSPAGRRTLVRIVVDCDGGIDLDSVADVSRAVSDVLDADDSVLPGAFVLEVSSPGVDRPLTEARHWRRAIGRLVTTTAAGSTVTGRVIAADGAGIRLAVDSGERLVGWADLGPGRVQVEFTHAAGPDADLDDADPDDADPDKHGDGGSAVTSADRRSRQSDSTAVTSADRRSRQSGSTESSGIETVEG